MTSPREDKPAWSAVPAAVKSRAEQLLGAAITRGVRSYGGYGPSATFVLSLDDGRTAFFKGVYPLPEGSHVRWMLDEEERVYAELAEFISPWAPAYYGSLRVEGWHALLMEAVKGMRLPPWTREQAERATRSYAQFHRATLGRTLPDWLTPDQHLEFAGCWSGILADNDAVERLAALAGDQDQEADARSWLLDNGPQLARAAEATAAAARPFALLHFDTRSDNVRLDGDLLRIFDWPFACVGPPEVDFAAFAQSVASEGGPSPEELTAWYSEVLPMRDDVLTAFTCALSGYFADRAPRSALEGLPRLRSVQRRQLKASLGWAARRLDLPEPRWLATVAD